MTAVSSSRGNSGPRTLHKCSGACARGIEVIVYDEEIPVRYYTLDFIHLTREGHAMIAAWLLPRIMAVVERREHAPGKLSGR
jgi:hypothetical protein